MTVRVCYLAQARKAAGVSEETVPWRDGLTLAGLLDDLATQRGPDLRRFLYRDDGTLHTTLLLTVNDKTVPRGTVQSYPLKDGDVVTLIPPVAGG